MFINPIEIHTEEDLDIRYKQLMKNKNLYRNILLKNLINDEHEKMLESQMLVECYKRLYEISTQYVKIFISYCLFKAIKKTLKTTKNVIVDDTMILATNEKNIRLHAKVKYKKVKILEINYDLDKINFKIKDFSNLKINDIYENVVIPYSGATFVEYEYMNK